MPKHRKRVKSYNIPGHAHELTFSCFRRLPLLGRDRTRQWFIDAMEKTRQRLNLAIWDYVIMPEHVHIIVKPKDEDYEIRLVRTGLKIPVQRKAHGFLKENAPEFRETLRDEQPNGNVHYRFWQPGGGYDRNIIEPATLQQMIEYIHLKPVRRGLVEEAADWIWSSARFYAGLDNVMIELDELPNMDS